LYLVRPLNLENKITLHFEIKITCQLTALMISSKQDYCFWIWNFQTK